MLLSFVFTMVYCVVTAMFGFLAFEHWQWWPGALLFSMLGQYFDKLINA